MGLTSCKGNSTGKATCGHVPKGIPETSECDRLVPQSQGRGLEPRDGQDSPEISAAPGRQGGLCCPRSRSSPCHGENLPLRGCPQWAGRRGASPPPTAGAHDSLDFATSQGWVNICWVNIYTPWGLPASPTGTTLLWAYGAQPSSVPCGEDPWEKTLQTRSREDSTPTAQGAGPPTRAAPGFPRGPFRPAGKQGGPRTTHQASQGPWPRGCAHQAGENRAERTPAVQAAVVGTHEQRQERAAGRHPAGRLHPAHQAWGPHPHPQASATPTSYWGRWGPRP